MVNEFRYVFKFNQVTKNGNVLNTHPTLVRKYTNYQKFNFKRFIGYTGYEFNPKEL